MLRGVGTVVALPWLESLASAAPAVAKVADAAKGPPVRAAFFYVPNGVVVPDWTPEKVGKDFDLPFILEPLKALRSDFNVLGNLTLDKARANGDGPGDHARAMAAFLTGRQPRKTSGADIRVGQSADQYIAANIGDQSKLPSLELGIERGLNAGNCDSGYSCAYSANLSWRSEALPNAKETDPKAVFERLFGNNNPKELAESRAKREAYNRSILDFVMEDTRQLSTQLASTDQRKLDEYLTAVRELEQRIDRAKVQSSRKFTAPADLKLPTAAPKEYAEHVRLMCDLGILAFQADITRVLTFPFANDGSNKAYNALGISEGHHELSHHQSDKAKLEKIRKINRFHIEQFAYFLTKLKSIKEGDKTLLDYAMVVYGSGIGDGNRHNHDNLPILFAGHGGGSIAGGRHIVYPKETPLMNLYMAMFAKIGAPVKSFGDSTGTVEI